MIDHMEDHGLKRLDHEEACYNSPIIRGPASSVGAFAENEFKGLLEPCLTINTIKME